MSKKQKVEKEYNPGMFMKNFIIMQMFVLYLVIMIGDAVSSGLEDSSRIFTRFIPVGIVAFIFSFLFIRGGAKKCNKSEKQTFRSKMFISPVIVAVVLLCYGLYSVQINISELKENAKDELGIYVLLYGEDEVEEMLEKEIPKAASEARLNWIITTVAYLVAAELGALLNSKKLDSLMLSDHEEPKLDTEVQGEIQEKMSSEVKEESAQEPLNNIKWDL